MLRTMTNMKFASLLCKRTVAHYSLLDLANKEVMQHHDGTDAEVNCRFVCLKRQSRAV